MPNSRIEPIVLIAAVIAAGLGLILLTGPLAWVSSIAGIILLLILFAYDREGYRSMSQSLAFSAVCGFSLVLAATGLHFWFVQNEWAGPSVRFAVDRFTAQWLPLTWVCATIVFWAIDRTRVSNRKAGVAEYGGEAVRRARGSNLSITGEPKPIRRAEVVMEERPIAPAASPSPVSVVQNEVGPVATAGATATAGPGSISGPASGIGLAPGSAPAGTPELVSQASVPARPLKEAMVYVGLVGEGLNVMRSVRAEHLGRNYYRIVEPMPEGERWEYGPGQVVRCEKKRLSSGKALVAVEEAPRQM
ncbi:MAG: hypothetical protein ACR2JB_05415 [Bryobacteraceae bacterium]